MGIAHDVNLFYLRAAFTQFAYQGQVVKTGVRIHANIGACVGGTGKVLHFGDAVCGQHVHGQETGTEQTKDHTDKFRDIGQVYQDAVAFAQTGLQQACRDLAGVLIQRAIGPALLAANDCFSFRVVLRACVQQGTKGFPLPVSSIAISLSKSVRPNLFNRNRFHHGNENYYINK